MQATLASPVLVVSSKLAYAKSLAQELIYASQFEIRGEIVLERETAEFGLSEFKTLGSKHYQILPGSLDSAMAQADQQFNELLKKRSFSLFNNHQVPEPVKGVFVPKEICVMDGYGAVIGLFTEGSWRKPTPNFVWKFMEDQARESRDNAAREAREHNYVEAQELRQYANYLDEMVGMSMNHRNGRIFREHLT